MSATAMTTLTSTAASNTLSLNSEIMFVREYDRGKELRTTAIQGPEIVAMLQSLIGENQVLNKRKVRHDMDPSEPCVTPACGLLFCMPGLLSVARCRSYLQAFTGKNDKAGEMITAGHRSYDIMLDLQLGIRWSCSRIAGTLPPELSLIHI